jgi:hypothetical protein
VGDRAARLDGPGTGPTAWGGRFTRDGAATGDGAGRAVSGTSVRIPVSVGVYRTAGAGAGTAGAGAAAAAGTGACRPSLFASSPSGSSWAFGLTDCQYNLESRVCAGYPLQAQSQSLEKVSVTVHIEILHAVALKNDISWFKECDAVSDGHVLEL